MDRRSAAVIAALTVLPACNSPAHTGSSTTGGNQPPDNSPPDLPADVACGRIVGGASDGRPFVVGLSRAHAVVRFFGGLAHHEPADAALASALDASDPYAPAVLDTYAAKLPTTCVVPPASGINSASVEMVGSLR